MLLLFYCLLFSSACFLGFFKSQRGALGILILINLYCNGISSRSGLYFGAHLILLIPAITNMCISISDASLLICLSGECQGDIRLYNFANMFKVL